MTERFGKWPKFWEMAQIHVARFKNERNGFTIFKMA